MTTNLFQNLELFNSLTNKEKETLSLFSQIRDIKQGEILFNEGENANAMYIVVSGMIDVYKNGKTIGSIKSGELVGEMGLFNKNKKRMASVKALKDSKLIVILQFSILDLEKNNPNIVEKIKTIINNRIEANNMNNIK